jgi:hypothetical protein
MRTAARAGFYGLILVIAALVVLTRGAEAFGLRPLAITGQSMAGTMDMGSLAYIDPTATPRVGDVITFSHGNRLWTHRIIEETHALSSYDIPAWRTAGDGREPDPFTVAPADIAGVVVYHIPFLGFTVLFMQTPTGWAFALLAGLTLYWVSSPSTGSEPASSSEPEAVSSSQAEPTDEPAVAVSEKTPRPAPTPTPTTKPPATPTRTPQPTATPEPTPPPDTTGPALTNLRTTGGAGGDGDYYINGPSSPCEPHTASVSVLASDPSGVASATLFYWPGNSSIQSKPMTQNGHEWTAAINAQDDWADTAFNKDPTGLIGYWVVAEDAQGNTQKLDHPNDYRLYSNGVCVL